jgi:peptide/nickel transport system permease protein
MKKAIVHLARQGLRVLALALLAMLATTALMRWAPGYFSDEREMDAQFGAVERRALEEQTKSEASLSGLLKRQLNSVLQGNLGRSRHYDVPVTDLIKERASTTAGLVVKSVVCGWALAFVAAVVMSARRGGSGEALVAAPSALVLAAPVSALATVCLMTDHGGPLLVLAAVIAARDFKVVYRLLRRAWRAPHVLFARASGMRMESILRTHLLPMLSRELFALGMTSFVIALSLAVPVEVIFDVPGLGQLAWSAALNRDLPVLLAVTLLMAGCVGVAASVSGSATSVELA